VVAGSIENPSTASSGIFGSSASAGLKLGVCMLLGGLLAIFARNRKGGVMAAGVVYLIGGGIGIATNPGVFADLRLWSVLSLLLAALFLAAGFLCFPRGRKAPTNDAVSDETED